MATRRGLLVGFGAAVLSAGCGFELRRPPELKLRSVQFANFGARSPLAAELRETIDATSTTRVVDPPAAAQAVLEAIEDKRERSVVATTAAGQVREFQLRARFEFRLHTPSGRELIAPTRIQLSRDMTFSEAAALGKEQEEALLYRAMQNDIVAQVMRRLAAVPAP
jgi:LPS-assembly lipoprotein